jgi:hypothetical protein
MFIRFKRVKLARKIGLPSEYSLHAVLVESYRQNGKPRQQIIAYLGSVQEKHLQNQMHRRQFYDLLINKLRDLHLHPRVLTKVQLNLINTFTHKISRQNQKTI